MKELMKFMRNLISFVLLKRFSLLNEKNGLKIISHNFLALVIATYDKPQANSRSPMSIMTLGIVNPCEL